MAPGQSVRVLRMSFAIILLVLGIAAVLVLAVLLAVNSRRGTQFDGMRPRPVNTLAVVALISAFVVSLGAVIAGHLSLAQIKRTHERGWALAVTALVLGYLGLAAGAIGLFFLFRQLAPYM